MADDVGVPVGRRFGGVGRGVGLEKGSIESARAREQRWRRQEMSLQMMPGRFVWPLCLAALSSRSLSWTVERRVGTRMGRKKGGGEIEGAMVRSKTILSWLLFVRRGKQQAGHPWSGPCGRSRRTGQRLIVRPTIIADTSCPFPALLETEYMKWMLQVYNVVLQLRWLHTVSVFPKAQFRGLQ